ncbi:MAG: winged helix-turn-helix domain-containing protein [Leptospirales bacterium]|nr:winged helix-turn-helix domain-containing protein [Leptospirales bacterium]
MSSLAASTFKRLALCAGGRLKRPAFLASILAASFPLFIYWDVALGLGTFAGDSTNQEFPFRVYLGKMLLEGSFPLYAPQLNFGHPFLPEFFSTALYPPNYLLSLLAAAGGLRYWQWDTLLHMCLGSYLMFRFLRGSGRSLSAALLGAACFAGSALVLVHSGHNSYSRSLAWSGALLLGARRLALRQRPANALLFSFSATMAWTAGSPPVAFMALLAASAYFAFLSFSRRRIKRWLEPRRSAVALAIVLFVFVAPSLLLFLISSPQAAEAARSQWENSLRFGFHSKWRSFLHLFYGAWFDYWPDPGHWEFNVYCGLLPALLALYAIFCKSISRERFFWLSIAALALLFAQAENPVYRFAFHWLPGFGIFRAPGRYLYWLLLALCVLSAAAWDRLPERTAAGSMRRRPPWLLLILLAFLVLLIYVTLPFYKNLDRMAWALHSWLRLSPELLVLACSTGIMLHRKWGRPNWRTALAALTLALAAPAYFNKVTTPLAQAEAALEAASRRCANTPPGSRCASANLEAAGADNFALLGDTLQSSGSMPLESERQLHFKQALYSGLHTRQLRRAAAFDGAPLAFVTGRAQRVQSPEHVLPLLRLADNDCALVVEAPDVHRDSAAMEGCWRLAPPEFLGPNRIRIQIPEAMQTLRAARQRFDFLYLSRSWSRGLSVKVDGREVQALRANYLFVAVRLPPDAGLIDFEEHFHMAWP